MNSPKSDTKFKTIGFPPCARLALIGLSLLLLALPAAAADQEKPLGDPARAQEPASGVATRPSALWGTVIHRDQFRPLTGKERWVLYWRQTYWTPGAFFRSAGPALGAHLANEPAEWGQGAGGYARRFGNRFARASIQDSLEAVGSAALGYDVRYVRSGRKGFFPRLGHAVSWNFLTLNRQGRKVFNAPRVGSAFAAEFIGNTWMPEGYPSGGKALRGVGVQLAIGSLFNTIREFVPKK